MLDFGFAELLVIIALAVLVIGPNEIPTLMVTIGRMVRRLQYIRFAITQQFDDFMDDAGIKGMRTSVNFEVEDPVDMDLINESEADADEAYLVPTKLTEPAKPQEPEKGDKND